MAKSEAEKIPSDWDVVSLDKVSKVIDSLHQTPEFSTTGFPMVRVTDIKEGYLDLNNAYLVSEEVYQKFTKNHSPQKGDIVISRVGSYGMISYVDTDKKFCIGQNTAIINPIINGKYLFYVLQSSIIKKQIDNQVDGSSQKSLSLKNIKDLKVIVPPLPEHKKIAAILSSVDEAIAKTQAVIEQTRKVKQGLLQQLLTRGIGHTKFKDSAVGKIPENWKIKTVGELFEVQLGKMLSPKARQGNQSKAYLGNSNVQWENIILDRVLEMDFSDAEKEKFRLRPGDLLVCEGGECGRAAIWEGQVEEMYYQKALHRLRPITNEILPKYMLQYIVLKFQIENAFSGETTTTTIAHIPRIQLMKIPVLVPPKEEQSEIIHRIDATSLSLNTDVKKLNYLEIIKRGLMQDLLTGRVRVTT